MQPETRLKIKLYSSLKKVKNLWFVKIQQVAIRGTPDIIACVNGHFVALELKRGDISKPSALQRRNIEKIRWAGGSAFLVTPKNLEHVLKYMRELND